MDFDRIINRRNTHSVKWDSLGPLFGVTDEDAIPMWVADMDFAAPEAVNQALRDAAEHGVHGYYGDDAEYRSSIVDWMSSRHGWVVDPGHIMTTAGLVNGTAMCVQAFTEPGDGVILFTPVYHAFFKILKAAGREIVESRMPQRDGRYHMDLEALAVQLKGHEKMVVLCSPHNPGGRIWSAEELRELGEFCERHDLLLVSDEIHMDLTFPGETHVPAAVALPDLSHRLVMMSAATKTFNIAGSHTGNVIIADDALRARFEATLMATGTSPNRFGLLTVTAAYRHGADWLNELMVYLEGNRRMFDDRMNAIPGLKSMALQATYLAWVDFENTGMPRDEFTNRVMKQARVVPNHGPTFGLGGDSFLRFNIACRRALLDEAIGRIEDAFSDLQ